MSPTWPVPPLATGDYWTAGRSALLLDGRAKISPVTSPPFSSSSAKKGPNCQIRKSTPFSSSAPPRPVQLGPCLGLCWERLPCAAIWQCGRAASSSKMRHERRRGGLSALAPPDHRSRGSTGTGTGVACGYCAHLRARPSLRPAARGPLVPLAATWAGPTAHRSCEACEASSRRPPPSTPRASAALPAGRLPDLTPSPLTGAQCGSNPTQLPAIMPGAQCGQVHLF
jgi:hypothetical protein